MKKSFITSAGVLALSVVIAKVLGAIYRIPLANALGAEGMGVYQFVYPVFALLLTLASGAVPNAISISVSEKASVGDADGAKKVFSVAAKTVFFVGLVGSAVMLIIAYPLSLLQSEDAFIGHLSIAPAILIVTLISAFRGWFMGHNNLTPSSISQITEGVVKLAVGLTLTAALKKFGLKYAVAGALLGVTASEAVTLIIMAIFFFVKEKGFTKVKLKEEKETVKQIAKIAVPLIVCGMILPASQFIDSVVIANLLRWGGSADAISEYGVWSGIVTPLINLPVMICITLGIAVTPQMVEGRQKRDAEFIIQKANTAIKLTLILGVPFVFLYIFMGKGIISTLYPRIGEEKVALATTLLTINSFSVISLSVFQIYSSMLQGLQRAKVPVFVLSGCMALKLVLTVALTPKTGIIGSAVAAVIGYGLSGVIISIYFAFFVGSGREFVKNAGLSGVCGVIMGMFMLMSIKVQTSIASLIIIGACGLLVYFLAVMSLGLFTKEELTSMPFSKILIKINNAVKGDKYESRTPE